MALKATILIIVLLLFSDNRSLAAGGPDYDRDIAPLLAANCLPCHNESTHTSGFSIATLGSVLGGGNRHGKAVQAGHPEQSVLVQILQGQLSPRMPMGRVLPDADIARIEDWIRNLSPDVTAKVNERPSSWPFQKPVEPKIPAVRQAAWVRNPIDAFVLEKLEAKGLTVAPEA